MAFRTSPEEEEAFSKMMTKLYHSLSRNAKFRTFLYSFLILLTVLGLFYSFFFILGRMEVFHAFLSKALISTGGRALSFALCKGVGCSGGLALAIGFAVKALLTSGVEPNLMNPSDDSSSAPSALEERTNELIQENLKERKGDLGDGQRVSEVRQGVEHDLNIETKGEQFSLIKQLEKEIEIKTKNAPSPVTNCAFNEIKEHESKIQDGRGGGRPNDCSSQEKDKANE